MSKSKAYCEGRPGKRVNRRAKLRNNQQQTDTEQQLKDTKKQYACK